MAKQGGKKAASLMTENEFSNINKVFECAGKLSQCETNEKAAREGKPAMRSWFEQVGLDYASVFDPYDAKKNHDMKNLHKVKGEPYDMPVNGAENFSGYIYFSAIHPYDSAVIYDYRVAYDGHKFDVNNIQCREAGWDNDEEASYPIGDYVKLTDDIKFKSNDPTGAEQLGYIKVLTDSMKMYNDHGVEFVESHTKDVEAKSKQTCEEIKRNKAAEAAVSIEEPTGGKDTQSSL